MWVKVKDELKCHYFVNTDMVSAMHLESSTVFLTAITGTGDGVLHLAPGEVERIAELLVHWKDIENAPTIDKPTTLEVLRKVKEQCVNGEGCDKCWYSQFCTRLPEEWEF